MKKRLINLVFIVITIFGFVGCAKKALTHEEYKKVLQQEFKTMSQQEQIEAIKKDGSKIMAVENPNEDLQLLAVRKNGVIANYSNISYIRNPTENVKLEVIRQSFNGIQYIKNPNETLQLEAVKQNGEAIQYIKNPSEAVKLEAVKQNGNVIKYILYPSKNIKNIASKTITGKIDYTDRKVIDFVLEDKNLIIKVIDDNKYSVSNVTKQFISIKMISFYYGDDIYLINDIVLPPNSFKELKFNSKPLINIWSENLVNFGFAVKYSLNEKEFEISKVNKYSIVEFLYKRYMNFYSN